MNIVITGATKGIGRAIAEKFAAEGFDIAACSRSAADLQQLRQDLLRINPKIEVLTKVTDVSRKSAVKAFAKYILSKWGIIDVLVNNAGLFLPGQIHLEQDGVLEQQMATNLFSAYHLTRALLPAMIPKGQGHIFNMCSIASLVAYPNGGAYSISKFAMLGFSKVLREEMKEKGIRVTAVMPGATWSDSWAGADFPEERLMQARDIALTIWNAHLLSCSAVVEEIIIRPQLGDL